MEYMHTQVNLKILITGKNGFVGKSIKDLPFTDITFIGRDDVDLLNANDVKKFFSNKTFDVVIHTAKVGGNRLYPDGSDVTDNNLKMFFNLLRNKNKFVRFINLSTGAERDRFTDNIFESEYPVDPYGMSKSIIAKYCLNLDSFYNLRIYNVFGPKELETRFIRSNMQRYKEKKEMCISQDKEMDFIFIEDLKKVIMHYIRSKPKFLKKEIDCVYTTKNTLMDIADKINNLSDYKVPINVQSTSRGSSYIGNSVGIEHIIHDVIGINRGIIEMYNSL